MAADMQNDAMLEANEYYAHFTTDKGLEGQALIEALGSEARQAREFGRDDLADALEDMVADATDDGAGIVRRFVTSRGDVVDTPYTDEEAIDILRTMKWSGFAMSLVLQFDKPRKGKVTPDRRMSDKQWAWVHKLAVDQEQRRQERDKQAAQPKPTFAEIPALFQKALDSGHKTPRITLDMDEGRIRLSVAGPNSRTPGAIHVTDGGPFGQNVYYGRIDKRGTFGGRNTPQWVLDVLSKLDGQTLEFVVAYGQKTGRCCFCASDLVTTESVEAGYGPVCAERYGLPWG